MKQFEVSLILCGYNAESTAEASLDSAIAQTLDSLEILCVNDGSTDRTREIFGRCADKDPRVKVIDHPANRGLLAARKTGVDNASGKYVMFLDMDDALQPEACAELARRMDETGCDLIQFDTAFIFASEEERRTLETRMADYFALKRDETLCGSDEILTSCFLKEEFPWNVWSKIYKTDLARRVYSHVPDDMNVVMAEDTFAFFVAASMAEKLSFVPKKYYAYRVGSGVSGNTDLRKAEQALEVYYSLIKPYADKLSSKVARRAADKLGKHFRSCVSYKQLNTDTAESYKDILVRETRKFGTERFVQAVLENWDILGMHPLKTVFLGIAAGTSRPPVKKIRTVGVICTGAAPTPSLSETLDALGDAGYTIRLFAGKDFLRPDDSRKAELRLVPLPDTREEIISFFDEPSFEPADDAYILTGGDGSDYELTALLLFRLRFFSKKPVLAHLEKPCGELNAHDRIFLAATDCVLADDPSAAPLFGEWGALAGAEDKSDRLKKILSSFAAETPDEAASAVRELMRATADRALAELGCVGFGEAAPLSRAEAEWRIAAAGSKLSADDYLLLRRSGFFDDGYYRKQFPDCEIGDTILHFCDSEAPQLTAPSAIFDPQQYFIENPDIYRCRLNPVLHYLRYGITEGRKVHSPTYDAVRASGYFDEAGYRAKHGDELGTLDPLTHYLLIGWRKGYAASDRFVDQYYLDFYVGLEQNTVNPLYHYIRCGKKEGRCTFQVKPRLESHFPEGYDEEAFRERKDKYLIVVHQLDFTGVPMLAKMVAEIFAGDKNVAIISPMGGPLLDRCLGSGIPVLIDSDFYIRRERAAFYREHGFGVCLFNTLGLIKTFLRVAGTIPSVLWIHDNLHGDFLPEGILKRIQFAPTVFATSETTARIVREYNPGVRYLPYPVRDMGGHHKESVPPKIRFGVLGVYIDRKGQDLAIRAFRELPPELKEKAELLLIGNAVLPEYAEQLEELAKGEKNIRFVASQTDPEAYHRLYENLEVQICPSRTDPMPLVVFDGMMHGCPVILADTVGQSKFIRDGENGYVFPAGDVTALRDRMAGVLENPDAFPELSRASRRTFLDNFEFTRAAATIRRTLDEVKKYFDQSSTDTIKI